MRAPLGLHLLLNVSPEWIEEAGDLHAEDNERNRRLYEEAQGFFSGIPGLVAARMDLDEVGGGVVDLFLAPVFSRTSRLRKDGSRGADIPEISVSKLDALWREQTGERLAYSGLQTLWADHCAERLDPRIQRGRRKSETGREHLTVPEFKAEAALAAALTAEAHAIIEKARKVDTEIQNERAKLGEQRRDLSRQAQIIQSRAHQAETVVARSRQMRTQNRVMHTNLQIAQATIDRQRKDLGLEQVRVLQSIRDENETIKNQLETERADILMWRDTQDLADAASREKDEQLAKEAKSLADRRKQLDEELVLFEAQKQALQRLLDEAAKAEEARKAERVKFDREREKQATETKNQISIVVTRQEELEARTRRFENDSERLEAEQQRLSQQKSDFAKDQRIFFENRDKLLAALKDQTEAQKTRAISLSDAETALRNRAVKLDDREATLAIGQFALAEAQNQVEEEAKRIAANGRDAADQFMTALRRGLTEIAHGEIDSDEILRQRQDLSLAQPPLRVYLKAFTQMQADLSSRTDELKARESELHQALEFLLPLKDRLTREQKESVEKLQQREEASRPPVKPAGRRGGGMEM